MVVPNRSEMAFSQQEYDSRIAKLRGLMRTEHLDAVLVHSPRNQCYLTGFDTVNTWVYRCLIVPLSGDPVLSVLELEKPGVQLTSSVESIPIFLPHENPLDVTIRLLKDLHLDRATIGAELGAVALSPRQSEQLAAALPKARFVDIAEMLGKLTIVKSRAEVDYIRRAGQITDLGIRAALKEVAEGRSDQDLAAAAYEAMIRAGSEYMSLQPIVTTGQRSGIPHTTHRRKSLRQRDVVFLEFGACLARYSAPIMRTAVVGPPDEDVRRTADAAVTAIGHIVAMMKPGVTGREVAEAAWKGIKKDRTEVFFHGIAGYSVGLSFPPNWADTRFLLIKAQTAILEPGMVFHLPIACRDIGRYTVGFSETVAVTDTGCEVMSKLPRELVVV
jgi:Xaa-Pro dipeptidase